MVNADVDDYTKTLKYSDIRKKSNLLKMKRILRPKCK